MCVIVLKTFMSTNYTKSKVKKVHELHEFARNSKTKIGDNP